VTINVEVSQETVARLAQLSASRGMAPGEYAGRLLDSAVSTEVAPPKLTVEEFHTMLLELSAGSEKLPSLPTSAFSRDSFYEGRT
jgi:hypothetical protein